MKKVFVMLAATGLLFATSCKKEETQTIVTDSDQDTIAVVHSEEIVPMTEAEATSRVEQAKKDLAEAKAKGDKEAEALAQKALDDANQAWEHTKEAVNKAATDVKANLNETAEKVDEKAQKAKEDINAAAKDAKKDINKAADDTKEAVNKAADDAKEGFNNVLDKAKIK